MLNLTTRCKQMVTHAPVPFIIGKNLWDLTGWEAGWNLDLVWTWFLIGKFLSLPDRALHNHCFLIELSWLMLVMKHY